MEVPRCGLAWWAAAGTAWHAAGSALPWLRCEAEPRGEPLPTSHSGAVPCHSTLPSYRTPRWWGTGRVPLLPAPLQGLARVGIRYRVKRKKVNFFSSCILTTAPTQRSKYKIFYPPPFQAISMLKYRQETG